MARSRSARVTALTLANVLLPIAILVFAIGFFPFKPLLPGLAVFGHRSEDGTWDGEQPEAVFDRVVFMVVDALRSDFVYGRSSGFEFTQSLIRDGAAIPFTAHATPPTVTMPRIKAITTGSVPSFADLIFNLDESGSGATLATQDTWLAQIRAKGGKLVFYGDDTWLRLFTDNFFTRADGTSSFFVSDFTEVDHNVTRHVPEELANDDWNAMIMHYLGLDHIGHKTGPQGPNMLPKQREMDGIVKMVYEAMEREEHHANTLLVLLGDHGMNAGGNHGGSGPGETEPALLFASPKLKLRRDRREYECPTDPKDGTEFHYYRKVEQSDIVPTLAGLMQLPVSKNNLGVFIEEFTSCWSEGDGMRLLYDNAKQMKHIVEAAFGKDGFAEEVGAFEQHLRSGDQEVCGRVEGAQSELACKWASAAVSVQQRDAASNTSALLLSFLLAAQETLSSVASSYDIPKMVAGMSISALALALATMSLSQIWPPSTAGVFFAATSLLYGVMMFASSYVEEEQHFWYWLTPAWTAILTIGSLTRSKESYVKLNHAVAGVTILAVHRIAIRWNQTGQKHAGEPDIVHAFFPDHHVSMWLLVLVTHVYLAVQLARRTLLDLVASEVAAGIAAVVVLPAIIFKLNFTQADAPELVRGLGMKLREWTASLSLVAQAQTAFALLVLTTAGVVALAVSLARGTVLSRLAVKVTLAERMHYLLSLFLLMQTRAPNVPLFLGLELQRHALRRLLTSPVQQKPGRNAMLSPAELATSVLLLSRTYFFCIGGSNSISSVDLSNAYNGVADYNIVAVGILLFASNWTGSIYWCSAAVCLTFSRLSLQVGAAARRDRRRWVEEEREKLRKDAMGSDGVVDDAQRACEHWLVCVSCMTAFVAVSLLSVMAACTALRTHLFIWTVFSPKYLYAMAWGVGWHVLVNIGLGSLLRWCGQAA
ncbi:alkaline phosphatase-like protein [Teratosphaeria nubilosa]|uniref:GPI ethanolamine phosphate transferase 2 n=1 Tax=Teratosphaeria nubilosa TaxID=161662 RepID=A0A6G1L6C0_9PEZI|nr:alkaline phosphatase-like protein [Teratosphaeria nubilosa]